VRPMHPMKRPVFTRPIAWPWLLVALTLILGPIVASCASGGATATPTPTKTPRPASAQVTATPRPTDTAQPQPATATTVPSATHTAPAPTTPVPTAAPPTATRPPATATPRPPAQAASMSSPDYGIQAFLWWRPEVADRDLGLIRDGGFNWVKQLFSWQDIEGAGKGQFDWSRTDRIVEQVAQYNLKLIVRVSQDPDRPFWAGNPPENTAHFADFLTAVATRYRGRIHAYQVWNEPNLAREWGFKRPDPAGYVRMLKQAYRAIKAADPNAIVVTAGMAPTGTDSEIAMPDIKFYELMYQAMGGSSNGYFDMLGVHGAGYAAPPELSPDEAAADKPRYGGERFFAFRHIEDARGVMERYGDAAKRVVVLEFGWTTDPIHPEYAWHGANAGITEDLKAQYLVRAYRWAAEHWQPWIGLMTVIYIPDVAWTKNTEQYWWAIIGPGYPDLFLRPAYVRLCIYLNGLRGQKCKYDPGS